MSSKRVLVFAAVAGVAVVVGAAGIFALWRSRQTATDASDEGKKLSKEDSRRPSLDHLRTRKSDDDGSEDEGKVVGAKKVKGVKLKHTFVNAPVAETAATQSQGGRSAGGAAAQGGEGTGESEEGEERRFPKAEPNPAQAALLKLWLKSASSKRRGRLGWGEGEVLVHNCDATHSTSHRCTTLTTPPHTEARARLRDQN